MSSWRDYPQKVINWNKGIDYAMFIDENGNSSKINSVFKSITNNKEVDENDRYFTITGCIFTKNDYKKTTDEIEDLKEKYWVNGKYYDTGTKTDRYVCFHSREIRRHDKAFNDKIINHDNFMKDLTNVLENINCTIISVTVDLVEYLKKGYLQNVYELAFDLLLERYIYATKNNKKGILMLEARRKNEDRELLNHITNIIDNTGRNKISCNELNEKIKGVYFNPKWNDEYTRTFTGLEIADLFSYPIHQYVKYNKLNPAFEVLKFKIGNCIIKLHKNCKVKSYNFM